MRPKLIVIYSAAIVFIIFTIGGLLKFQTEQRGEKYCDHVSDCSCGMHKLDRVCFVGNKNYVLESDRCSFYCAGFRGELKIKCVENECLQVLE